MPRKRLSKQDKELLIERGVKFFVENQGKRILKEELAEALFGSRDAMTVLKVQRNYLRPVRERLEDNHRMSLVAMHGLGWITTDGGPSSIQVTQQAHRRVESSIRSRDRKAKTIDATKLPPTAQAYFQNMQRIMEQQQQLTLNFSEQLAGLLGPASQ